MNKKNEKVTPETMESAFKELEDVLSGKKSHTKKTQRACIYISKWPSRQRKESKNVEQET